MSRTTTRSGPDLPDADTLDRLKLSPEVGWYLASRRIPLPDCPPRIKTPEPRDVPDARFDPGRVDRVLKVFSLLRHTKGKWAGQPLKPDPWQVAYILAPVFGWVRPDKSGRLLRIIRTLYVDVPRRNGKSTTLGGIAVYLTTADGEQGAEVVAAATTKDQAGFVFAPVKILAEKSPALAPHVKVFASKITHPRSGSYFTVISSVADAQHGANLHGAVIDELHVHKTADLVETLETGTGSRDQPLIATITTADDGRPNTPYAQRRERVEKLAALVLTDPTTYGVIWAAEPGDDPFAVETQRKANPGFGVSPTAAYLTSAAVRAQQSPAALASYQRLHLGLRTKQTTRFIGLDVWDAAAGMVDEASLDGRVCHGGLDLASVSDLTALCWDFPAEDRSHDVIWRFWLPEAALPRLNERTAGAAAVWVREGWLRLTPGNVLDNDAVVAQIDADARRFRVATLGFDAWGANDVVRRLTDSGMDCVPIRQGFASLSAPMKELLRLLLARQYRHGGNPVMRWMVDNLAVRTDPAGNVKPDRQAAADKIDGVAAAVNALRECMAAATAAGQSIYETADVDFG